MTISIRRIFQTWWPLAASWLLMSAELPALSAVVARLADPEIHLAAYGGVVFPVALVIESPIIMLLAASTALSKDWASYAKLRRFMMTAGAVLTALHALLAFTPLYDIVIVGLLHPPEEIIAPARIGLIIMLPWTWSIAYRRFHQGVLIRFNRSRTISVGTIIRLIADLVVLIVGFSLHSVPGIVVATGAVATGVLSEAVYVGIVVRPVLRNELRRAKPVGETVTMRSFLSFYVPLVMTALLSLLIQPLGSAALGRMPQPLVSLAAWPVVNGLVFSLRSLGIAYNEVVVALLDENGSSRNLHRFSWIMAAVTTGLLFLITATPLAEIWFVQVTALNPDLAQLAKSVIWLALPIPGLSVFQSWYQGTLLHSRQTHYITESVVIFLSLSAALLALGVVWGGIPGLYVVMGSFVISTAAQTGWLWLRSRGAIRAVFQRDLNFEQNSVSETC